ncbi:hypothetical protein KIN20_035859 [Parelaphostrongylus tenuis]|uniref:Uncharacterized protein n=1 Tax=Parelaphostrongylus tenuis TaxID=148309 RepID=A0AAD5RCF4_PARTN|nr:hypothetical protein KIN20_035859 [Parelaphostrongylus tenuis]
MLHNDWQPLLDSTSDQKDRLDLSITTHGDYRETIGTSVSPLENLNLLSKSLDSELLKRGLQIIYDASDEASGRKRFPIAEGSSTGDVVYNSC